MVKKAYPGMRFYPTDVELILFYLKRKIKGKWLPDLISEVNIYKFSPWDLPGKALLKTGDLEWHFLCPKEMKYANGPRFNRAVEGGFWKSTGQDRPVKQDGATVGMIKTLVFHLGHAPKGDRTNWVIHEYRIVDPALAVAGFVQDSFVLCKLFQKSGSGPKNGEQHGAPFKEEDWATDDDDDDDEPLLKSPKLLPEFQRGEFIYATAVEAPLCDKPLLESFKLPEFQPGECSYASVVEAPLSEPAVRTSDDNGNAMLGRFTREDFSPSWDNPIEMPANNGTGGVVLEEPVVEDGNDIFCGLDDLGDWRGLDGELSIMDYDCGLFIDLDDLVCPLDAEAATTQESQANHYFVHPKSTP